MGSSKDLSLRVLLQAQNLAGGAFSSFGNMLRGLKDPIDLVKIGLFAAGAAVIGFAAVSVKMAADYQQSMTQLQNTTGSTDAQMKGYAASIRQISDMTGKAQTDLAKGMYQVVSANFAGADAAKILTTATKAAVSAGADQTQVTTGLVVSLNAWNLKADQADSVSNRMFKTLALGRGNMGDLAGALQTGGALVAHYGVSITDMDATLATLSTGGMKTFGTSMTGMTQLLNVMSGKTDMMAKRIHKLGIPFDVAKFKTMDYMHQVAYLNKALENNKGQTVAILGSKQAATALGILGTRADLLASNLAKLSDKQQLAKESADAWARTQQDFNFKLETAKTRVQNLMIDLGGQLLPVFSKLVTQITPLITSFVTWIIKSGILQTATDVLGGILTRVIGIIIGVAGAIGNLVGWFQQGSGLAQALGYALMFVGVALAAMKVAQFISTLPALIAQLGVWAAAQWAVAVAAIASAAPFILIGVIVAAVVIGIILLIKNWARIMDFLGNQAQITADKVALAHTKMRISADENQKKQAEKTLANLDLERAVIVMKMKNTHNLKEKLALSHQLFMVDIQIAGQNKRLAQIEADRQKQIAKQKELQAKLQEDQKNWFVRLLDDILGFFGMVFGAIGNFFGSIFGALGKIFAPTIAVFKAVFGLVVNIVKLAIGLIILYWQLVFNIIKAIITPIVHFFQMIWGAIAAVWSVVSGWFGALFSAVYQTIVGMITPVVQFFKKLWQDVWNGVVLIITPIGKWFGDRWKDIQAVFVPVQKWFQNIWTTVVNDFKSILSGLGSIAKGIWDGISNGVKGALNFMIGLINNVIGTVDGINVNLPGGGYIGFDIPKIPKLSAGIENFQGGMAYVHAGEVLTYMPRGTNVTPAHRVSAAMRASGGSSSGSGGGGGNYIHHGDIIIYAQNANAKEIEALLDRKFRRSGSIVTTTSGGRASS